MGGFRGRNADIAGDHPMPHAEPHKAEQPAALVPAQGVDTEDVSRIDTAALWQAICRISGDYIAVVDRTGTIRFSNW